MITVFKYEFKINDEIEIEMPKGAEVLLVENQGPTATPCMWVRVDTERPMFKRKFYITGTGHSVLLGWKHVASFQDRSFVWHVWE